MRNFQQYLVVLLLLGACSTVQHLEQDVEIAEHNVVAEAQRIGYEIPKHIDPVIHAVESPAVMQLMHTIMQGAKYAAMAMNPAGQAELVHEAVNHFRQRFAASLADPANAEHDPETVANAVLDQTLADKQQEWTTPADTAGTDGGLHAVRDRTGHGNPWNVTPRQSAPGFLSHGRDQGGARSWR